MNVNIYNTIKLIKIETYHLVIGLLFMTDKLTKPGHETIKTRRNFCVLLGREFSDAPVRY